MSLSNCRICGSGDLVRVLHYAQAPRNIERLLNPDDFDRGGRQCRDGNAEVEAVQRLLKKTWGHDYKKKCKELKSDSQRYKHRLYPSLDEQDPMCPNCACESLALTPSAAVLGFLELVGNVI